MRGRRRAVSLVDVSARKVTPPRYPPGERDHGPRSVSPDCRKAWRSCPLFRRRSCDRDRRLSMLKTKEGLLPKNGRRSSDAQRLAEQPFTEPGSASRLPTVQAKKNGKAFKSKHCPESDQAPLAGQSSPMCRALHCALGRPLEADRERTLIT